MWAHSKIALIMSAMSICSSLLANGLEQNMSGCSLHPFHKLCIASQYPGILQHQLLVASMYVSEQNLESDVTGFPEFRSESTATLLAVFPGFFIHGLGHFYAGDGKTGAILFALEVLSLPVIRRLPGLFIGDDYVNEQFNYKHVLLIGGVIIFLGSWTYDYIHASTAVRNHNREIMNKISLSMDQRSRIYVMLPI